MAFSVAQMYPGAFTADVNFVDGKYKNSSAPGVYDGTPLDNLLFNQNLALFDALMLEANLTYNNSADIPSTSQLHKAMQIGREVSPRNNGWNGYLDPEHQSSLPAPNGYPGASGGGEAVYDADEEISFGIFAGSGGATVSSDSDGWIFTGSIYKLFDYTTEQLADIDVTKVPVYLKDQAGVEYFVNDSTAGVNVTKVGSQLKVEITAAIFTVSFTKLWRFFVTERVGRVVELSVRDLAMLVTGGRVNILDFGTYTSGAYTYPFGLNQNDFEEIVAIASVSQSPAERGGASGLVTQEQIQKYPTSWTCIISSQAGESVTISYTSDTSFSVSVIGGSDSIKQVIGHLKRRA